MTASAQLFERIKAGDQDGVAELVAGEPGIAAARDENGLSALLLARYYGRTEIVDELLAAAPALDVFEAAALGRRERVAELLDADPSLVNAWSSDGFTPLHLASFFGAHETVKLLLERRADVGAVARNALRVTALHSAAASRQTAIVRLLIEWGADVNAVQERGFTPLHEAAQHGDRELTELLLAAGADPRRKLDDGKLPVDLAHEHGHTGLVALLEP